MKSSEHYSIQPKSSSSKEFSSLGTSSEQNKILRLDRIVIFLKGY
jgi:hypothetical protein